MAENYMNQVNPGLADGVRIIERSSEPTGAIKVAAYCRVSTNLEIQQRSLEIQIEAFNRVIREHPGWELAGIYADKGISGTQVLRREEFKRMIEDVKHERRCGLCGQLLLYTIFRKQGFQKNHGFCDHLLLIISAIKEKRVDLIASYGIRVGKIVNQDIINRDLKGICKQRSSRWMAMYLSGC